MDATGVTQCPYCFGEMRPQATRCPHCAGELRYCPKCRQNVGVVAKQKFVGLVRGGTKTQLSCGRCYRVLDGPRF